MNQQAALGVLRRATGSVVRRLERRWREVLRREAGGRRRPVMDVLEPRQMLSAVSWDGGGDGSSWGDALNWSGDVVPGASDDVSINVQSNPVISVLSGNYIVRSLVCDEGLTISGGSLTISSQGSGSRFSANSAIAISGGAFVADSGVEVVGAFTLSDGSLGGSGAVLVEGTMAWSGGTMSGAGTTSIAGGGLLTASGMLVLDGRTLTNAGSATVAAYLEGFSGAVVENSGEMTLSSYLADSGIHSTCMLVNSGSIAIESDAEAYCQWNFQNSGTASISTPWMMFSGDVGNSGMLRAIDGSAVGMYGEMTNTGTVVAVGAATLYMSGSLLGGSSTGLSGAEAGVRWTGLSTASGATYTYEVSENGGDYEPFDGSRLLTNLKRATEYTIRATSTDANGGKRVYESSQLMTLDEPDQTGTRWLVGFADETGTMVVTFPEPVAVTAGSSRSAMWQAAKQAGLVTDGTVPQAGFDYRLAEIVTEYYSVWGYTFEPEPYLLDTGSYTADPSAQQGLSQPTMISHWLTPVWKYITDSSKSGCPHGKCPGATGDVNEATGTGSADPVDLESDGFGFAFTLASDWTSDGSLLGNDAFGTGTIGDGVPRLLELNRDGVGARTVELLFSSRDVRVFERVGTSGEYRAAGSTDQLTHSGAEFVFTTAQGDVLTFNDFSASLLKERGQFVSRVDAAGNNAVVTAWTADGQIQEIRRRAAGAEEDGESWLFSYLSSEDENAGRVASVALRRSDDGETWTTIRSVTYGYYGSEDANGTLGARKLIQIHDGGTAAAVIETRYFRYYLAEEENGYAGGLKYFFDSASYARLEEWAADNNKTVDEITDSDTLTMSNGLENGVLAAFANDYYEYDSQRRCTVHASQTTGCSGSCGGVGTTTYTYCDSNPEFTTDDIDDPNVWYFKTIETLNDGNVNIYYSNFRGEVLLKLFWDKVDAVTPELQGKVWGTFYKYDASGRQIWEAKPSALDLPLTATTDLANLQSQLAATIEQYSDLLHFSDRTADEVENPDYEYLRDDAGEISITDYYTSTTATDTTVGGADGYVMDYKVRQGELGADVLLECKSYIARTTVDLTTYRLAADTVYGNEDGTGARTTTYTYTWYTDSQQVKTVTIGLPVVSTGQNGSGTADTQDVAYDAAGRVAWQRDGAGYLTYTGYDKATGAIIRQIVDAKVSALSAEELATLPSGWTTPAGGGLHLVTTDEVDEQGRVTKETSPEGRITYTVYNDAAHEVRTYRGWDEATHLPTGPIEVYRSDYAHGYSEWLTSSATPTVADGRPTGQEVLSAANIQALSRSILNEGGQVVESDDYSSLSGITYSPDVLRLGTAGTNYLVTLYGYEKRGRQTRIVSPDGTVTVRFYDGQGNVRRVWVGTDDVPAADYLPDGIIDWRDFRKWVGSNPTAMTGPAGTNMVKVAEYEYDNMSVGDGNRTQSTQYADASTTSTSRYVYDWRDRLTDAKAADGLVTKYTYDNLGEVTRTQVYRDADSDWVIDAGELRAQSESLYDAQGRVYRQMTYEVDPSTHAATDRLTSNVWYDPRGYVVKSADANGLFQKSSYDGAGRLVASYVSYDADESTYAEALNVTGDTVLEQNRTWYDGDGNVVVQANYKRLESDTTSTGQLTAANSYASSSVAWYDLAGRQTTSAVIGHESGTGTRYVFASNGALIDTDEDGVPDVAQGAAFAPNSSDDYIVSQVQYDGAGNVFRQIDNAGRITQSEHDMLGRTTRTIANYVDGVVSETEAGDTDQTTEYVYDGNGRVSIQRALNPQGAGLGVQEQDTRYLYEDERNASLLTNTIYPDSSDTDSTGTDQTKFSYDWLGRKLSSTDQRGVVHSYAYDSVGRLLSDTVTDLGRAEENVDGSVRRIGYAYDDQGRVATVTSYDAVTGGGIINQIAYTYDGWGNVIKSQQSHSGAVSGSTPATQYVYEDGAVSGEAHFVRLAATVYPDGRTVYNHYEAAASQRLVSVSEDAAGQEVINTYTYLGMGTMVQESRPSVSGGLNLSYGEAGDYSGWDRFGRIVSQEWRKDDDTLVDGYGYSYNRAGDRVTKTNLLNSSLSETYAYDGLSRLTDTDRGEEDLQNWGLDALGNWDSYASEGETQTREQNAANETTGISGTWVTPVYDAAGNMTTMPKTGVETVGMIATYDAWNRLTAIIPQDGSNREIFYSYDGLGRRITKLDGVQQGIGPVLVVNDGNVQRSMVDSLTIVFDHAVTLESGAIELVQRGVGSVSISVSNPSGDERTFLISFTGAGLIGGSLADGIYDLSVDGSLVLDTGGNSTTSDETFTFHRLFGDLDGNGRVTTTDIAAIKSAYLQGHYMVYADFDADGLIESSDLQAVTLRYAQGPVFTDVSDGSILVTVISGMPLTIGTYAAERFGYYYNENYQVIETREDDQISEQTVYDQRYIDAPVVVYRDTDADGVVDQSLYVTQDANFDVTATVDGDTGAVVNRFVYTPYGQRTVLTATWTVGTTDFNLGHQGLMLDQESGLYYNRARYLHSSLGTFTGRDPLGYVNGMNVYEYEGSRAFELVDPSGMGFVNCPGAIAKLLKSTATLSRRILEAVNPDSGHIRAIRNSATQVKADLKRVMDHCGDWCGAVAAMAAAARAIEDAAKYIAEKIASAARAAAQWAMAHPRAIVGTFVVVGGFLYVVMTGGGGAIMLVLVAS